MREIKFRAWDYKYKETSESFNVLQPFEMINKRVANGDSFELMQYTGLKDKNGKEIYEGDIVSFKDTKYEVIFHKSWGSFCVSALNFIQCSPFYSESTKYEVIGNIYENEELLKG